MDFVEILARANRKKHSKSSIDLNIIEDLTEAELQVYSIITCFFQNSSIPMLKSSLHDLIFPDKDFYNKLLTEKSLKKSVCGKKINLKDISFKCFDCQKDETCIICKECFENSDHKGHRVILEKNAAGCCDCGDDEAWKSEGFCKDHLGYKNINEDKKSENMIPEFLIKKILEVFSCFFYFIFDGSESFFLETEGNLFSLKLSMIVGGTMDLINEYIKDIWELNTIFFEIFKNCFKDEKFKLLHDCENYKKIEIKEFDHKCNCSILENIFRFILLFDIKCVNFIKNVCFALFPNYEFKKYLTIIYCKMFYFYFENQSDDYSDIVELDVQLFTSEDISKNAIENVYFDNFLDRINDLFVSINVLQENIDYIRSRIIIQHLISLSSKQNSAIALSKKKKFWEIYFNSIYYFNFIIQIEENKKPIKNNENSNSILNMIDIELNLIEILTNILKYNEDCLILDEIIKNIIEKFNMWFKNYNDKYYSFHIIINRCFNIILMSLINNNKKYLEKENLKNYILEFFNFDENKFNSFINNIGLISLKTFIFMFRIENKFWNSTTDEIKGLANVYFSSKFCFYDNDLNLLQFSINLLSKNSSLFFNDFFKILDFENMLTNILKKINCQEKIEEKYFCYIDNLFLFFINLYSNCFGFINTIILKKNEEFEIFSKTFVKNFLKNYLIQFNEIKLKQIKFYIFNNFLKEYNDLEKILDEICDFDQVKKTFRLKNDKEFNYNSFLFCKNEKLIIEYNENINNKLKNQKEIDILGLKTKNEDKLYQKIYFPIIKFIIKHFSSLIFGYLKTHLIAIDRKLSINCCFKLLSDFCNFIIIEKNYDLLSEFNINISLLELLENLKKNHFNEIYENSKIDLINIISQCLNITKLEKTDNTELKKNDNENIKKQKNYLEKQKLLKQKFLQQQMNFINNQKNLIETEINMSENNNLCVICKDIIKNKDKIGQCCFLTKSNLIKFAKFQHYIKLSSQSNNKHFEDLANFQNTMYKQFENMIDISSCSHNMHYDCFLKYSNYKENTKNNIKNSFSCPLCCRTSNILILENCVEEKKKKIILNCSNEINQINTNELKVKNFDLEKHQENKEEITNFFDEILKLFIFGLESEIDENNEDQIIIIIENSIIYYFYLTDIVGLPFILNKKSKIYKNYLNLIKEYLFLYNSDTKEILIKKRCEFVREKTNILYNFSENFLELDYDKIFIEYLTYFYLYFDINIENSFEIIINVLCEIILLKNFQYSFLLIHNEKKEFSLENLYEIIMKNTIKINLPFLKRVMSIFYIFFDNLELETNKLTQNILNEEEEFSYICNQLKINYALMLKSSLQKNYEILQKTYEKDFKLKDSLLISEFINELYFNLVDLDENFSNLNKIYSNKKCDLCNDYGEISICLICGVSICIRKCNNISLDLDKIGNLNKHSLDFHCGNSIFISIVDGDLYFISFPYNYYDDSLMYCDKYGQKIKYNSIMLENFHLNVLEYNKLKDMIIKNEIKIEIDKRSKDKDLIYQLNYF